MNAVPACLRRILRPFFGFRRVRDSIRQDPGCFYTAREPNQTGSFDPLGFLRELEPISPPLLIRELMNKQQSRVTKYNKAPAWPIRSARWWVTILAVGVVSALSPGARAETSPKSDYVFVNAVDNTQAFLF